MKAEAFSPSHITGFFEIYDRASNLLHIGSKGAGISFNRGVVTKVWIEPYHKPSFIIKINGQPTQSAYVSQEVLKEFFKLSGESYLIHVEHQVSVPIGSGFGSSGAGALSLSLALNEALSTGLSKVEAAQIAHIAEVKCKTGLGTVAAEVYGGLDMRLHPGAPGVGIVKNIPIEDNHHILCLHFGPISTHRALCEPMYRNKINGVGGKLLKKLVAKPSVEEFLKLSRRFTDSLNIMSDRVRSVILAADSIGFVCSMAMFGESVFTIVEDGDEKELQKLFQKTGGRVFSAEVDQKGARLVE